VPGGTNSLTCLRRTDVFVPAELKTALGLKLPRIIALNPGYVCSSADSAGSMSSSSTEAFMHVPPAYSSSASNNTVPATRVDEGNLRALAGEAPAATEPGTGGCAGQVLVVQEMLELPQLTAEMQAQAASILKSYEVYKADTEAKVAARRPPEGQLSQQLQQDAAEVALLMQASANQTLVFISTPASAAACQHAPIPAFRLQIHMKA
jgi:hypothetical protein